MQTSVPLVLVSLESSSTILNSVIDTSTATDTSQVPSLQVRHQFKLSQHVYIVSQRNWQTSNKSSLSATLSANHWNWSCPKYGFFPLSGYNNMVNCRAQPDLDYNLWRSGY